MEECDFQFESFHKCPNCKIEVSQDDQYCDQCGTKLELLICKDCNRLNRAIARNCAKCGSKNLEEYIPEQTSFDVADLAKLNGL